MVRASSSGLSSVLAGGEDTIVARATPPGTGALAVIRVSGARAWDVVRAVAPRWEPAEPWRAVLIAMDVDGVADRAVAIPYRQPRSFTGEDMVELIVHGSPWLVERALDAMAAAGARRALPGEFTRRAVANGKMALEEAEAIGELVRAETRWQARAAAARASGEGARRVAAVRDALIGLMASVEGALDFADQELGYDPASVEGEIGSLVGRLDAMARAGGSPAVLRGAVRAVVAGPPNAGKSSLFNRLIESTRAIVSPRPGTTRDTVEAQIALEGRAVVLVDTAGLGIPADPLEAEGVRRTAEALADADLVLLVQGADLPEARLPKLPRATPVIRVLSRLDLAPGAVRDGWIPANPATGEGVGAVREALAHHVVRLLPDTAGEGLLSVRAAAAAAKAAGILRRAPREAPELLAEALRRAAAVLEGVVAPVDEEAVLDRIFSTFCLGK